MTVRCGDTLLFQTLPVIAAGAAVGGKKEGEGPLAAEFDELFPDNNCGQANWETAEKILQLRAARLCLKKAHATEKQVSLVLAGDLQAQCTASSYALRELGIPFVFSAPLVRSSYNAEQAYASLLNRQQHMPSEAAEPRGSEQP